MKTRKAVGWKLGLILLASGALAFGQVNNFNSTVPPSQPDVPAQMAQQPPEQAGPGTVNYVEGQAYVDGQALNARSTGRVILKPGQTLETGNGRVEVLLTPGAYFRLGHDSQAEMLSAGLVDTRLQLLRGTALVEVDDLVKGTRLQVSMNGATAQLIKKGLYDFDAADASVQVLDGKAKILASDGTKTIGGGHEVLLASAHPLKSRSFDKKAVETSELYIWSNARSEDLAMANRTETNIILDDGGWYGPGWYWNPYWDFYAFMPAYGMYSPFGWGFYSPLYFGYYGGGYYGGYAPFYRGYDGHDWHYGHRFGHPAGLNAGIHHFHGMRPSGFAGGIHSFGGFHGMAGGFHGMAGGFHGGARR